MKKIKPNELTTKIGMNVKLNRIKNKLTQEKLAELANISRLTVSNLECGFGTPTVDSIASIAKVLDVELYKMFIFE